MDLGPERRRATQRLMEGLALVGTRRLEWHEAYPFVHGYPVGRVMFTAAVALLPLTTLWRADATLTGNVMRTMAIPSTASRHALAASRELGGLQLPVVTAEAGIIPWLRVLMAALLDESPRGEINRAIWAVISELEDPSEDYLAVAIVRRAAAFGIYVRDLRFKETARILDWLASGRTGCPRSYREHKESAVQWEVLSLTLSVMESSGDDYCAHALHRQQWALFSAADFYLRSVVSDLWRTVIRRGWNPTVDAHTAAAIIISSRSPLSIWCKNIRGHVILHF